MELKEYRQTDRNVALCLAEMAAIVADGFSLDSCEKCQVAVDRFNHYYGPKLGERVAFDRVWEAITDLELLPHFTIPARDFFNWKADGVLVELLLYGLLEENIHWCGRETATAELLTAKFTKTARHLAVALLDEISTPEQFRRIVSDLVALAKHQSDHATAAEIWLFQILCKYDLQSAGLLESVCDLLFASSIDLTACREMDRVISGPNGSNFVE